MPTIVPTIGFIGGGNMATSLIGGLLDAGINASAITVAEPDEKRCLALHNQYGISTSTGNKSTLSCEIIVLAVKPQLLKKVCQQLEAQTSSNSLFISIAAGIKSSDINSWLNGKQAIVRCMPNTPSLLQCGASGLYANENVSAEQKKQAETIMQAVGLVLWVDNEKQINAVTAVSGSGPAYFFLLMEAMQKAGEELGLNSNVAQQLVMQTALGAARMAIESESPPAELRQMVTSKGGTTEQAILSFQSANFQKIVMDALQAANDRSISLAEESDSE
ncbi:Pyrroline-5-carboxylate reductase [hydrothermal vent metagenome]|uniref:Pyrroline-5-carboxylate reductase n=1 Tax=hydrothermal vent metagenome TaxID=652676 RepID=A0A3B0WSQ1_9ZZZZ